MVAFQIASTQESCIICKTNFTVKKKSNRWCANVSSWPWTEGPPRVCDYSYPFKVRVERVMLRSQSKYGDLFFPVKSINVVFWVWNCHVGKHGPSCVISCPFVPLVFFLVLSDYLFCSVHGCCVVLLWAPSSLFCKFICLFNVCVAWNPL